MVYRLIGVTDLCDYPSRAKSLPKVSKTLVDCSTMSMEEVEEEMQKYKARGLPPFEIDTNFLAQYQPGTVLTQNVCQTCDPSTSSVIQAGNCPDLVLQPWSYQLMELITGRCRDLMRIFEPHKPYSARQCSHGCLATASCHNVVKHSYG